MTPPLRVPLEQLRRRTSIKWRLYPADVLPLWVAEMDVDLAAPVVEAVRAAMTAGDTGYGLGTDYAEAYAGFADARWGLAVDVARTAVVADVMTGVGEALRLLGGPGDPVVLNPPVYPPFYGFAAHAGREVVEAPLGADGRLDLDALEAAFVRAGADGRPVTYLLCSPHNPSAVVHRRDELEAVARLAARYRVRVVVDEIHAPLADPDVFVPYLAVDDTALAVVSASKGWNLAGLKAAMLVAGTRADDLQRLPEIVRHGPSHLGMIAQGAAWTHGRDWLDALRTDLDGNRVLLAHLLDARLPGARWNGGDGTYLAWLDLRALDLGDDPAAVLLERGRVALNSGLEFGPGGAGHARLNYATSPPVLAEAIDRMASATR